MTKYCLIIFYVFISSFGICQQPNYGQKKFYLIDSLDLNLISTTDKKFVDSCLTEFHQAKHDTARVQALMGIVNNIWNDNV